MKEFSNLKLPLVFSTQNNLWLGNASNLFLRFPQPQGAVWQRVLNNGTSLEWLFRYPKEAKSFAQRLQAYSVWLTRIFF